MEVAYVEGNKEPERLDPEVEILCSILAKIAMRAAGRCSDDERCG